MALLEQITDLWHTPATHSSFPIHAMKLPGILFAVALAVCTCHATRRLIHLRQIVVIVRLPPIQSDGPANVFGSHILPPRLMGDDAEKVNRVGLIRIHLEDLSIELISRLQPATLMVLHGNGKGFGDRGHGI